LISAKGTDFLSSPQGPDRLLYTLCPLSNGLQGDICPGIGKRRRPRLRWVDSIKIDLREIRWDGMDWIDLAQDRDERRILLNTVMNLRVP
jgi:hypothetical protein